MKKIERKIITELLDEIATLKSWLDDTGYPKQSRDHLDELVQQTMVLLSEPLALSEIYKRD